MEISLDDVIPNVVDRKYTCKATCPVCSRVFYKPLNLLWVDVSQQYNIIFEMQKKLEYYAENYCLIKYKIWK